MYNKQIECEDFRDPHPHPYAGIAGYAYCFSKLPCKKVGDANLRILYAVDCLGENHLLRPVTGLLSHPASNKPSS